MTKAIWYRDHEKTEIDGKLIKYFRRRYGIVISPDANLNKRLVALTRAGIMWLKIKLRIGLEIKCGLKFHYFTKFYLHTKF